jgi:hypothetical protein
MAFNPSDILAIFVIMYHDLGCLFFAFANRIQLPEVAFKLVGWVVIKPLAYSLKSFCSYFDFLLSLSLQVNWSQRFHYHPHFIMAPKSTPPTEPGSDRSPPVTSKKPLVAAPEPSSFKFKFWQQIPRIFQTLWLKPTSISSGSIGLVSMVSRFLETQTFLRLGIWPTHKETAIGLQWPKSYGHLRYWSSITSSSTKPWRIQATLGS